MAKRYRYAFAKKKEAGKGKLSAGLAVASFLLFLAAVLLSFFLEGRYGFIVGSVSLFAALLSVYGFSSSFLFSGREIRIYCGKRKPICGAVVRLRIYYGTFKLFRRKL